MISSYDLLGGDAIEMLLISSGSTVNHLNVSSLTLTFDIQFCSSKLLPAGSSACSSRTTCQGDILTIDTAALTGEPLPRKYPSEECLGCVSGRG